MTESMTIAAFEELIGEAYALDKEIEKIEKDTVKPMKAKLQGLENKILAQLEAEEKTSYKSKFGTVVRMRRYTVRVPQSKEDKSALFDWLQTKGDEVYYKYLTVNSQSLNSLYKTEMEIAKEEMNFDFKIPGLGQPEMSQSLSMRAK